MVTLRALTKEDLSFLLEVRNDESTRYYLENNSIFTLEQCENWFDNLKSPWYIITNQHLKAVGYLRTNDDEVGCDIHPLHRKQGYAKAAYQEYLKNKTYASLWVFKDNFAINLYYSLGFIPTGEIKHVRNKKYIRMKYSKNKIAKIIPCYPYFHNRGNNQMNSPNNFETWKILINNLIEGERKSDPGVDLDVILYLRTELDHSESTTAGREILNKYAGEKLPRGTIFVKEMPNDHTMGFSTIKHFIEHDSQDYTHMIFQEDDIYLLEGVDGYANEGIEQNENIIQLAVWCIRYNEEYHIAGFFSLSRIEPLKKSLESFPLMKQKTELQINKWALKAAGCWGVPPKGLKSFKNYPKNINNAVSYTQNYIKPWWNNNERFLFNIGIETF
jgi:ribosomal protein S18 acetylase RimI-like enzyme